MRFIRRYFCPVPKFFGIANFKTMTKHFLTLALSALAFIASAQNSGTIIYKETSKLHFSIQGDAPPPENLPTERNAQMILYFNSDASLYMNDPSIKNDDGIVTDDERSDGEHIRIKMDAPDNRTYCDLKNNQR